MRLVLSHDLVVDTGAGDSLTDIYGFKRLAGMLAMQSLVIRSGKPLIFGPQTVGPFRSPIAIWAAGRILRRASAVFVRDHFSQEYVETAFGVKAFRSSDLVFALPTVPEVRKGRHDVLLNVSGLLWEPNNHVNHLEYRDAVFGLIAALQDAGRKVSLLAHVIQSEHDDNDVPAVMAVQASLSGPIDVIVPKDLDEARAEIASCRLLVGARMHSVLNALSVEVPGIAWAYSRKFGPLLSDIGWPHVFDLRGQDMQTIASDTALLAECSMDLLESSAVASASLGRDATRGSIATIRERVVLPS